MSNFPNRRWLIIPVTLIDQINFDQVMQSSPSTLRYSLDGTKTFIKYDVSIVEQDYEETIISAETNEESVRLVKAGVYGRPSIWSEDMIEYTHAEILEILSTAEWTDLNKTA